jgi:hypothetical protein
MPGTCFEVDLQNRTVMATHDAIYRAPEDVDHAVRNPSKTQMDVAVEMSVVSLEVDIERF